MSFDKNIAIVATLGLMLSASAASAQMKGENDSGVNRSQADRLNSPGTTGRSMSTDGMQNGGSAGMRNGMSTDTTGRGSSTGGKPAGAPGRS